MRGKHFMRIFSFMKPYLPMYIPGMFLYSAQGFIGSIINALFLRQVTQAVLDGDLRGLVYAALTLFGLYALAMPLIAGGILLNIGSELKAVRALKAALFRAFLHSGMESAAHSGEGIAAINTDADAAAQIYNNALFPLLYAIITIVFSAAVVFAVDYRLGLASVGIGLLGLFIQARFARPLGIIGEQKLEANAASVKGMSEILSGSLAVRAFNAQAFVLERFEKENLKIKMLAFKAAYITGWQQLFTTVQGWLTLTGVFTLGGYLVATKRLSFPALMMVPALCQSIATGMSMIGTAWAGLQAPLAACGRVLRRLDERPLDKRPQGLRHRTPAMDSSPDPFRFTVELDRGLVLRGVCFSYHMAEGNALENVSLEIKPREMTVFVGASGSGKSTLLKAVAGLFERDGLDMRWGGISYTKEDIQAWRRHFAYVDQSCVLFNMSIAENIALGAMGLGGALPDSGLIEQAAREAYADEFIRLLPQGYDTPCGEKGASLSGGQKQRIAIARALARRAEILVFDEATSALDEESERQVMETIAHLRGTHTVLFATHHLKHAVEADTIVVMDNGRVVETGRHLDLMAVNGMYKRLYEGTYISTHCG